MPKYKCESELSSSGRKKRLKRSMKCDETTEKTELNDYNLSSNDNIEDNSSEYEENSTSNSKIASIIPIHNFSEEVLKRAQETSQKTRKLREKLAGWSIKHKIARNAVTSLLKILRDEGIEDLPSDSRTLLKTPRFINIEEISGGQFIHIGLEKQLKYVLNKFQTIPKSLELDLNVDGALIFKTVNEHSTVWPVLCRIKNLNSEVFAISIFGGSSKPANFTDILHPFIEEYSAIKNEFSFNNIKLNLKVNNIILDAPARSAVCGIAGHNGKSGCPRCYVKGIYVNGRMTFVCDFYNTQLRTDKDFRAQIDKGHHRYDSSFVEIEDINMITQFPIDYLHNVLLGVTKKLLEIWFGAKGKYPIATKNRISSKIMNITKFEPSEFNRKLRSLDKMYQWKGKEFRTFLLFVGPVVLKNEISTLHYDNFIMLHVAITILVHEEFCKRYNRIAKELLIHFVDDFEHYYGKENVSYNVHLITHLADDCMINGRLDNFSAFKYESFLGKLKDMIESPAKPIEQLHNRISELLAFDESKLDIKNNSVLKYQKHPNIFMKYTINNMIINCESLNDCYIQTSDKSVLKIINFSYNKDKKIVAYAKRFNKVMNQYDLPIKSTYIDACNVKTNDTTDLVISIDFFHRKMFPIPINDNLISLYPLLKFEDNI